jgi:hypothetical protein
MCTVQEVFGLYNVPLTLAYKPDQSETVENVKYLAGNTVYAFRKNSSPPDQSKVNATTSGFNCPFLNIQTNDGRVTSLLLENPVGCPLADLEEGLKSLKISQLYKDERRSSPVQVAGLSRLAGQTLYA